MAQVISWDDKRLSWHGHISLEPTELGVKPWRLPYEQLDLFPGEPLQSRASMPAGVRLTFRSNTANLSGIVATDGDTSPLDLCCDGVLISSQKIAGREKFEFSQLPPGEKLIELWLPQFGQFQLGEIAIDDEATLAPFEDTRSRWLTYGSSITHCRDAASPTTTWPAIVARESNVNLTCLGYGGNCHLEPMVARMIRDLSFDFLSVCCGINIMGGNSLSMRTLRPAVIGFVKIVRERHPDTPFAVISPIYSEPRETTPNLVGLDLTKIRGEVAAAVEALQQHGDKNLYYIDGRQLFAEEHAGYLPDKLHPNAEGYEILARNFLKNVAPVLFGKPS